MKISKSRKIETKSTIRNKTVAFRLNFFFSVDICRTVWYNTVIGLLRERIDPSVPPKPFESESLQVKTKKKELLCHCSKQTE